MEDDINNLVNSLFRALAQIQGINYQSYYYLREYSKHVEIVHKDLRFSHLSTSLILQDIKAKNDKEWKQIPIGHYGVNNKNASKQTEAISYFHNSLSLSYAYELFEIFIKKFLTIIDSYHSAIIESNIKNRELKDKNTNACFKNLQPGSNNNNYFKVIRRICPKITELEVSNYRELNYFQWYEAFSIFRHSVVHTNMVCPTMLVPSVRKLIENYFPVIEQEDCLKFNISYDAPELNLILIGEYTYLIATEFGEVFGYKIHVQ